MAGPFEQLGLNPPILFFDLVGNVTREGGSETDLPTLGTDKTGPFAARFAPSDVHTDLGAQ